MTGRYSVLPSVGRDLDDQAASLATYAGRETALCFYNDASSKIGKMSRDLGHGSIVRPQPATGGVEEDTQYIYKHIRR